MATGSKKTFNFFGLSQRLLFYVLLCSTGFTLLATTIQLYYEYEDDVSRVDENLYFIRNSYAPAIVRSLFEVDE